MEKFIIANQTALRISDTEKNSPCIVLLHGYLESLDIWDEFSAYLSRLYRVITLDLPGHGISQVHGEVHSMEFLADVLHGVLQKQGVERCFVVGHSMGGYVAEAFAAKYPEQLLGLVLFHSTPNTDTEQKRANRLREIQMIQADKKELIASLFAANCFAEENHKRMREVIEEFEEQITLHENEGVIALLKGMMARADQNEMLRKLNVPQLFVFGRQDQFIPLETAEKIIQDHPQAQVAWLEHSAHAGFLEEPERSAQILADFIDGITGGRA